MYINNVLFGEITGLTLSPVGQFFYILLLVAFICLLAYYSTRLIASSRNGRRMGAKRNMTVIESMGVGANAFVQIVRIGDKYFLIGVTKERVTMLVEINEEQIAIPETRLDVPFNKIFERFIKREENSKNNEARDDET